MARKGGNPLCVGKKGRSGRKSKRDEELRTRVLEKAWIKKDKKMTDQDATQIVLKDMTVKSDIMSGGKKISGFDIFDYVKWIEDKNNNRDGQNTENVQESEDSAGGN
jgi:hypothetical protein